MADGELVNMSVSLNLPAGSTVDAADVALAIASLPADQINEVRVCQMVGTRPVSAKAWPGRPREGGAS